MSKQYYYHLTTSDCVDTIKHEGLKPMLGENALLIKETKPKLCLCSDKSIDAWAIMLSADTVIKVSVPDKNTLHLITNDGTVDEFNYDREIPAKYIESTYKVHTKSIHQTMYGTNSVKTTSEHYRSFVYSVRVITPTEQVGGMMTSYRQKLKNPFKLQGS